MVIPFNNVVFENDNNTVAIDADNLNEIEEALKTACDGGENSGLDADTVRGKILTNPLKLKKNMVVHLSGGNNLKEYPDELSPLYFQNEWRTLDSWTSSDSTASVSDGHLVLTPIATPSLSLTRTISGFQSKTLKIKIKDDGNISATNPIRFLNGSSSYDNFEVKKVNDYWVGTIETDNVGAGTVLNLQINITGASMSLGTPVKIQWIYLGSGDYDFKKISNSPDYPLSFKGVTPVQGNTCFRDLFFDGVNDKITSFIPSSLKDEFSILFDTELLLNTGSKTLLRLGESNNGIEIASVTSGSSIFSVIFHRDGGSEEISNLINLSSRKNIAFTYKNSSKEWKLYVDGSLETSGNLANTPLMPLSGQLTFGCSDTSSNHVKVNLGHLFLYSSVLSEEEIWDLYQKPHCFEEEIQAIQLDNKAPEVATSKGNVGEIRFDSSFIYVCIAPNTWKKATLASW
jgi:hypothetical protein